MSDPSAFEDPTGVPSPEEMQAALFADLVMRQVNMALMFLGQIPMPKGEERAVDLEAARMFIDQLEVLEAKTRGNLTKPEEQLLKQSLTNLRLAFVQVSAHGAQPSPPSAAASPVQPPPPATPAAETTTTAQPGSPADDQTKVRFSKKYGA